MKLQDVKEMITTIIFVMAALTIAGEMLRVSETPGHIMANPGLCAWATVAVLASVFGLAKE